jgi:hypothetical protein
VLRELEQQEPTDDERQRVRDLVQDMELDAYAQATIASRIADDSAARLDVSRRWSSPLAYGFTLAFLPLVYALSVLEASTWAFAASTITLALALVMVLSSTFRRHTRLERSQSAHRKVASDYLIVAERAKAYRMLHVERSVSAEDLYQLVEDLRRDKERQDRSFHPTASELEAARAATRVRVVLPAAGLDDAAPDDAADHEEAESADRVRRGAR